MEKIELEAKIILTSTRKISKKRLLEIEIMLNEMDEVFMKYGVGTRFHFGAIVKTLKSQ